MTSYREDPLYLRIARAVDDLLRHGNVVAPADVLIAMELLTREQLRDWGHGRVPFLERVINCDLTRLGRLLRILQFHVHDLNLKPSWTAYMRWGKGPKQRLRFTKTGDARVEEAYATHFLWPGKMPFHEARAPGKKEARKEAKRRARAEGGSDLSARRRAVSEYQYYEFQAIDRPLTEKETWCSVVSSSTDQGGRSPSSC